MTLESLMEKKQLDFDRPLPSVRRNSKMIPVSQPQNDEKAEASLPKVPPLPVYKSELKSGPVKNPGTVPFNWERSPGHPKEEARPQSRNLEQKSIMPRPPPGRIRNAQQQASVRHFKTTQMDPHIVSAKDVLKCTTPSVEIENVENCGSGNEDDDAYVDAADMLSRSESFFLNCSVSGVSGWDDPDFGASMDPQTRDFMMGRFLPAAKAMASETPPHVPRKQRLMAREKPREFEKVLVRSRGALNRQNNPIVDPTLDNKLDKSSEENEEHDETDDYQSTPKVACGLLPQLWLRSSLCLLNPVPGMKSPVRKAASVRRIRSRYPLPETSCEHGIEHHKVASEARKDTYAHQTLTDVSKSAIGSDEKSQHGNGTLVHENYLDPDVCSTESTKGRKNFGELLAIEDNTLAFSSAVEKTVYVDTVCEVKYSDVDRGFTDREVDDSQDHDRSAKLESRPQSISLDLEEKAIAEKSSGDGGFTDHSIWRKSPNQEGFVKSSSPAKNESRIMTLYNKGKPRSKEIVRDKKVGETEASMELLGLRSSKIGCFGRPISPPLPKAPTDSWLKRAMLTKNAATSRSLTNYTK